MRCSVASAQSQSCMAPVCEMCGSSLERSSEAFLSALNLHISSVISSVKSLLIGLEVINLILDNRISHGLPCHYERERHGLAVDRSSLLCPEFRQVSHLCATEKIKPMLKRNILVHKDSLLRSEKYADLTIKSQDRVWLAHKAIICSQCEFFDRACTGGFRASLSHSPCPCSF
jgi:hypothetical protein